MNKFLLNRSWEYVECRLTDKYLFNTLQGWRETDLPHDYGVQLPRHPASPAGVAEGFTQSASLFYKKIFVVEEQAEGQRFWLEFESVAGIAAVWVNAVYVTQNLNPYTGFVVEVTDLIRPGENLIALHCTNTHKPNSRWYTGTGITGHVWLHQSGTITVAPWTLHATTETLGENTAGLAVEAVVDNPMATLQPVSLAYEVRDASDTLVAHREQAATLFPSGKQRVSAVFSLESIEAWRPEAPALYKVSLTVTDRDGRADTTTVRTGLRRIEVNSKDGFLLNGKPMKLRGGCIHHDLGILGAAGHTAAIYRKVKLLKDNGFNALRFAHNAFLPAYYDACDEMGVLVVAEAYDEWVVGRTDYGSHLSFAGEWEKTLETLVGREYNHPSIIMWSTGNEVEERDGSADGFTWSGKLAEKVRSLDKSRPVTVTACSLVSEYTLEPDAGPTGNQALNMAFDGFASGNDVWGDTTAAYFAPVDVAGYNYKTDRYRHDGKKFPQRVICGSETHPVTAWDNWQRTLENNHVIGDFVWTAMDYLGEAGTGRYALGSGQFPPGAKWPWLTAHCGDLDLLGDKRPQSHYRDVVWQRNHKPRLFVLPPQLTGQPMLRMHWTWLPVEPSYNYPGSEGQSIEAHVYAWADEVALLQNGVEVARKKLGMENAYTAVFKLVYQPGTLEAIAYQNGEETGRDVLYTQNEAVSLEIIEEVSPFDNIEPDLRFVKLRALDDRGKVAYNEYGTVSLQVEGGQLLAFGNADPAADRLQPFTGSDCPLYHGVAMAVVRSLPGTQCHVLGVHTQKAHMSEILFEYEPYHPDPAKDFD